METNEISETDLPAPPLPRILDLAGAPFPKAVINYTDAEAGFCSFSWLNSEGAQVDSGGSVARFTPLAPLPPAEDAEPDAAPIYPEVSDEILADAIANPPPEVVPVPASVTRRQLFLWLNGLGITRAALRTQLAGNEAALIELEEATEFQRAHPLVAQLGQTLGLGSAQIDDAFRNAATL